MRFSIKDIDRSKIKISQEGLKLIGCLTMLLDHIDSIFLEGGLLRIIGRLSFPIYCFLIAEGIHHTHNPKKYGLRLLLLAVVSEIPFELAFFNDYTPYRQNVMIILLLGFCAVEGMKKCPGDIWKALWVLACGLVAEQSYADYGIHGVLLIVLFALTRDIPRKEWIQLAGMAVLFYDLGGKTLFTIWFLPVTRQALGVLSMIPISLYSGEKRTRSKAVQWGFYLFYPVHLLALWGIWRLIV